MNRIRSQWNKKGYVVIPRLFDAARVEELREICDRILEQWIDESTHPEAAANSTNMAFLTEPRYFERQPERRRILLNAIGDETILSVLSNFMDGAPLFHNTQYFFNPATETRGGDWHRDQQFGAADETVEKLRMKEAVGIHAHIALLPDDNLDYVPGSHLRWDTPSELEIRKGLNGQKKNSSLMPKAERITLETGDAVFFSAWGIHRGNYVAGVPRRTFDIIFGTSPGWFTPPPTCFLESNALDDLTPPAHNFFARFIETYRDKWLKGEYDI
jgi:ectoine hydroxylase-related dioxygenase (phytanoyl-CoA dioxygenase family)